MKTLSYFCFFGILLVLSVALPANAATVMPKGEECPPISPTPTPGHFLLVPALDGSVTGCFVSTAPIWSIDLTFSAPPAPASITCIPGLLFASCNVSETSGITDVALKGGAGIPNGTLFELILTGFSAGQVIVGTPNVPEPATGPTVLLAILASVYRKLWTRRTEKQCA